MDDFQDDSTILSDDQLLRRVPPWPNMVKFDENLQKLRPTSACFSDEDGGVQLSVTLETPLLESGFTHQDAARFEGFGVARVSADRARNMSTPCQKLVRNPTDDDPHHALVVGEKSKSQKRKIAQAAELVITPVMATTI